MQSYFASRATQADFCVVDRHYHPRAAPGRRQLAGVHRGHAPGRRVRRVGTARRRARHLEEVPWRVRRDRLAAAAGRLQEAGADRLHGRWFCSRCDCDCVEMLICGAAGARLCEYDGARGLPAWV